MSDRRLAISRSCKISAKGIFYIPAGAEDYQEIEE